MDLAERLRGDILSGRIALGTVLSQTDLAKIFGVSRIPVRDALQSLAADKLVEVVPGRGARVISLSSAELAEIYDMRVLLEKDLLRRAIALADSSALAEAEYALHRSALEAGRPGWSEGDWQFHAALYAAAGRPRHMRLVRELRTTCVLHVSHYGDLAEDTPRWLADHTAIFNAFAARRSDEAVRLLADHIDGARTRLMTHMPPHAATALGASEGGRS